MSMSLRQALSLAVGPRNVDAAGHAIADWLESRHGVMASLVRTEVTKDRPAELDQDVPHDRPDTSVRTELMAKLATQREVILSICERVDRLEARADGLTPIERVQRRWAKERSVKESLTVGGDGPAVPEDREPAAVVEQPTDAELVRHLKGWALHCRQFESPVHAAMFSRAAELLQQRHPEPVPVGERLPELRGMFERILCVARSSGQRPVGNIELADRLISAVASWAALPLSAGEGEE